MSAPLSPVHAMLATIERVSDARRLNEIGNHATVYPWVRGWLVDGIDYSAAAANPDNVCLIGEHGSVVFAEIAPGIYEGHTQALPVGRGKWMLSFCRAALHWAFTRTLAVEIVGRAPAGNVAVAALMRRLGFRRQFTAERGWVKDRDPIPATIYSLTLQEWMIGAPGLIERGRWFHARLEEVFARHGKSEKAHADDDEHDRAVGLAVEMAFANQPEKSAIFYQRWASLAGYVPFQILSREPLSIDIGTAILILQPERETFWAPLVR